MRTSQKSRSKENKHTDKERYRYYDVESIKRWEYNLN
jgi:hypothetical protein